MRALILLKKKVSLFFLLIKKSFPISNIADYRVMMLQFAVFTIPFTQQLSRIAQVLLIIAFVALYFLDYRDKVRNPFFLSNRSLLLPFLYLFYVLSFIIFNDNLKDGKFFLERMLLFLLLPPVISSYHLNTEAKHLIFKTFVVSTSLACVICFFAAIYNSVYFIDGHIIFEPRLELDPRIDFWRSINWGGNRFFSDPFSIFHHPSYFSMYILFSICLVVLVPGLFKGAIIMRILLMLFLITIFLLSSRASLLTLVVLVIVFFSKLFSRLSWRAILFISSITLLTLAILIWYSPRIQEIKDHLANNSIKIDSNDRSSVGNRVLIWSASSALIKDHFLFGVGVGDVDSELQTVYRERGYIHPLAQRFNCHNEYLQHTLMLGLMGLLWILMLYGNAFFLGIKNRDLILMTFIIIVALHAVFESIFQRYSGVVFFAFFYPLLITNTSKNNE